MNFCKYLNFTFILSLLAFCLSCAHTELAGEVTNSIPSFRTAFNFSDTKHLKEQLKKIDDLKNPENQRRMNQILVAYSNLKKDQSKNQITLLPQSKTQIVLNSFCASSKKAVPETNEIFKWVKGQPKIAILKEVLNFYAKNSKISTHKIQELIWNLENGTYFEDYPDTLKEIIVQASPSAPLILPSRTKSKILQKITPQQFNDVVDLIEGEFHSFDKFREILDSLRSNIDLPRNNFVSKVPGPNIYTETLSRGHETQVVTFYNPNNASKTIGFTEYYLKPLRVDVQPIVLAAVFPYEDEIDQILKEYALKLLGQLGALYPTLNSHEQNLVKENPIEAATVFYNAYLAEQKGDQTYPNSEKNGESDAFRHFVWAGLLTRDLGEETARKFLNAHELTPGQLLQEKAMDESNNESGIQAAKKLLDAGSFDNPKFYNVAIDEIKNRNLVILNYEKRN